MSKNAAQELLDNSIDGLKWFITSVKPTDDIIENLRQLDPLLKPLIELRDKAYLEQATYYIEQHFNGAAKGMVRTIRERANKARITEYNASSNTLNLPITAEDGIYYKKTANSKIVISNFQVQIKDRVLMEDIWYYRCRLESVSPEQVVDEVLFSPEDRCLARKFRVAIASVGDFHFNGRDNELSAVWQYEQDKNKDARQVLIVHRYGALPDQDMWLFANCVISRGELYRYNKESGYIHVNKYNIRSEDVLVYQGAVPYIDTETKYTRDLANQIAKNFNIMLDATPAGKIKSYMGYLILGFVGATIYSDEIYNKFNVFPFLYAYGPKNTGKSSAVGLVMSFFGFNSNNRENFGEATRAGMSMAAEQLSSIPYWLDEIQPGPHFEQLKMNIKNFYNRIGYGKGSISGKRQISKVRSTFWFSGQYLVNDEAVLTRSVIFRFNFLNDAKNQAWRWLDKRKHSFSVITRNIILNKDEESARQLLERVASFQDMFAQKGIDSRVSINYSVIAAGLQLFGCEVPDEFDDYLVNHAIATTEYTEQENEVYLFFKELNNVWVTVGTLNSMLSFDTINQEIAIRFEPVMGLIQKEVVKRRQDDKLKDAKLIRDYLKDLPGFEQYDNFNKPIRRSFKEGEHSKQRRCIAFKLKELPEKYQIAMSDVLEDLGI